MDRKEIRAHVAELIDGIKTEDDVKVFGGRVYPSRMREIRPDDLPCVLVYTRTEDVKDLGGFPKNYHRTITLNIKIFSKLIDKASKTGPEGDAETEDTIDDLSFLVEQAIESDQTLQGQDSVSNTALSNVDINIVDPKTTETNMVACTLIYDVEVIEQANSIGGDLEDFKKVVAEEGLVQSEFEVNDEE